ncbi:MAG: coenzyme F420-0:L-glutamate ligase [Oscillospiraceae bacterium]|nr:coenzyme F420-0:L-glutamate ligase [Oscillospiraceae bacterium]
MKNTRTVGTVIRGIRTPIIREGDNLGDIITRSVLSCAADEGFNFGDRDIVGVTEAVVARAQGNYVSVEDIAADIKAKFGGGQKNLELGVVFPILSRNRFAVCLKGVALAAKKIYLMLSYPSDEVGNQLFDPDLFEDKIDLNALQSTKGGLSEKKYREIFGFSKHLFTGVDYIEYYRGIIEEYGAEAEIIFSNNCLDILDYTKEVLVCDIHTRKQTKRRLISKGGEKVLGLDNICSEPPSDIDSRVYKGYNEKYGLLGSNTSTETSVKLFPRDCDSFVSSLAGKLRTAANRKIEVLIFGDGAFKDPQGKIWELADPVVSPAYTEGLEGVPNEVKLKYLADNQFKHLKGEELDDAVREYIKNKDSGSDSQGSMQSLGTTPRKITDLIGSLCDLSSGSGDKGTPVVLIQGYFDNLSS